MPSAKPHALTLYPTPRRPQVVPAERTLRVLVDVGKCVGSEGLVGGQVVDIMSEGAGADEVTLETLKYIHAHKTGALLEVTAHPKPPTLNPKPGILNPNL